MKEKRKVLALITARGGSKALPGKNIKNLGGKPLIVWTIEAALKSSCINKVIVSTDSEDIAVIARRSGADVPFLRPKELATDNARSIDVILHALDWLFDEKKELYDIVILLQPTSPHRTSEDIDSAIELFIRKRAKAIVSVCEMEHSPLWANTLPEDGHMKDFLKKEVGNKPRQELPRYYRVNGAIYIADCGHLRQEKSFFGEGTFAYVMPKERSADIDSEYDFGFAEFILRKRQKGTGSEK